MWQVPLAWSEGLGDDAIVLQVFLGLAVMLGTVGFGAIVVNNSKQCVISAQYLLQTAILGIGQY